ncbi:unnamed protein product [Amoebophrya sp. A120]|nr:unnamed protein product [Amoebophrya sp. A120]|eukprot:GSA120T00000434001.1
MQALVDRLARSCVLAEQDISKRNSSPVSTTSTPLIAALIALETVQKLLSNVVRDPNNDKFRRLRPGNATLQQKLEPLLFLQEEIYEEQKNEDSSALQIMLHDRQERQTSNRDLAPAASPSDENSSDMMTRRSKKLEALLHLLGFTLKENDTCVWLRGKAEAEKDLQYLQRCLTKQQPDRNYLGSASCTFFEGTLLKKKQDQVLAEILNGNNSPTTSINGAPGATSSGDKAKEQLQALRNLRSNKYKEQQTQAMVEYLSRHDDDDFSQADMIALMNKKNSRFVTCFACKQTLRYKKAETELVLCVCGQMVPTNPYERRHVIHSIPEAGEPIDPREMQKIRGPMVELRSIPGMDGASSTSSGGHVDTTSSTGGAGSSSGSTGHADHDPGARGGAWSSSASSSTSTSSRGQPRLIPLHALLSAIQEHEETKAKEATHEEITALPRRMVRATDNLAEDDRTCRICLEGYFEPDLETGEAPECVEVRTLPCLHFFHTHCVDQWLRVNKVCPTCRHEV